MVEKSWTLNEVVDHDREHGDTEALWIWLAMHEVDELAIEYEAGNKAGLLRAIFLCANSNFEMPDWVKKAYVDVFNRVLKCEVDQNSWDAAFGKPYPKGTHIARERFRKAHADEVYEHLWSIVDNEPGTAIDDGLFERVGHELGIGGSTLCKEIYYEFLQDAVKMVNLIEKYKNCEESSGTLLFYSCGSGRDVGWKRRPGRGFDGAGSFF